MSPLETLGFTLGTSFAAGLNLYATVATAGLLEHYGVIHLPPALTILGQPIVWGLALAIFAVEFVADKVPLVDSVWDAIHTFIRPPAAALLAYGAFADVPEPWKVSAALLAGGIAFTSHGAKATTRVAVNASPEPFSNWALSVIEDMVAVGLSWLATTHPVITTAAVIVLLGGCVLVIWKLWGIARRVVGRLPAGRPAISSVRSEK
jgi:uncharacterized protein DUF4126